MKVKNPITCDEVRTFYIKEEGRHRIELRIVRWNKGKRNVLEFRWKHYKEKEDMWEVRRSTGIGKEEFEIMLANKDEILQLLSKAYDEGKE